ncbi:hypothetical protein Tco_1057253 [Tanacetum coccineum]|uniref:Uncharacterized protein n=1 Tax=Tanacetum coccineum TaxID=301880 RepID=A0ABQ5H4Z3_9ASTR
MDCMLVVKEIKNKLLEEVEKLEWWFEQDIDDEGEEDKEDEGGDEDVIEWQSMVWIEEDAKGGLDKQGSASLRL